MKRTILSFLMMIGLTVLTQSTTAQSPGGVGTTNLTAWWNPDVLPLGDATSWSTMYPAGASAIVLTDGSAPYASVTNTPTGNHSNYNKTIDFTGNVANAAGPMAMEKTGTLNLLDNNATTAQGTFFAVYFFSNSASGQHIVDYRESGGDAIQFRKLSNMRYATTTSNSVNATKDFTEDGMPMLMSAQGNKVSTTSLEIKLRSLDWTGPGTNSSAATGGQLGLTVGMRKANSSSYTGPFQSFLSELIFFNTDLGFIDMLKVESYLAVKYGITLDPLAATSGGYLTSASTAIWDPTATLTFHNDVIGIGRDDGSTLMQKQSHSFDDIQRIYLNSLATSTASNTGTFTNDISYVMMGHNLGALNETAAATAEMPSGMNLVNRIGREYRVTNTNMSNTFSIDMTLTNFTNFTSNPGELCLLVDTDDDFSNATVFKVPSNRLGFAVNGNVVTISGISTAQIPLDSTRYLALASFTIPAPIDLVNFDAKALYKTVLLNWQSGAEYNFSHFNIQHSLNATDWADLANVEGKGSDSQYEFVHNTPNMTANYYRLKMTDIDNSSVFSDLKIVEFTNGNVKVYPNPVTNILWIEGSAKELQSIKVYNHLGQEIGHQLSFEYSNTNLVTIDFSTLAKGIYSIKTINSETKFIH